MESRTVTLPETVEWVFMDWGGQPQGGGRQGMLFMTVLGATGKLVGIASQFDEPRWSWAHTIDPALNNVPRNDDIYTSVEALLDLQSNVVVFTSIDRVERYENASIPVIALRLGNYDDYISVYRLIGEVLGGEYAETAAKFINFYADNINLVTKRLANIDEADKPSIYYVDGAGDTALVTMGQDTFESFWIPLAGAKAASEGLVGRNITITEELLLKLNPDMIFVGTQFRQHKTIEWIMNNPNLRYMDAVRNKRIYRVPQGMFLWSKMGPESSMQMVWSAKLLHPDKFEDINIAEIAKGFYRGFFNYDASDEEIAMILSGKIPPDGE
jgi:iron complex transport system substrate-binding protein